MRKVLYKKMRNAEKLPEEDVTDEEALRNIAINCFKELHELNVPGCSSISEKYSLSESQRYFIFESQRNIMDEYKNNPVFKDAIKGKISLEDSLSELAQVNRPFWRLFPKRRHKAHNERLGQMEALVGDCPNLMTEGILFPDNFVGGITMVTGVIFGVGYLLSKFALYDNPQANPEEIQQLCHLNQVVLPSVISTFTAPLGGLLLQRQRPDYLPVKEAKYLDGKVQEFYK